MCENRGKKRELVLNLVEMIYKVPPYIEVQTIINIVS